MFTISKESVPPIVEDKFVDKNTPKKQDETIQNLYEDLKFEKLELFQKICKTCEFFGLQKKKTITKDSTLEDLKKELARLNMEVNKKSDPVQAYKDTIILMASGIENVSKVYNPLELDLDNYASTLYNNKNHPDFDTSIKQLILKYDLHKYSVDSPEFKLIKFLGVTAYTVSEKNKERKKREEIEKEKEQGKNVRID